LHSLGDANVVYQNTGDFSNDSVRIIIEITMQGKKETVFQIIVLAAYAAGMALVEAAVVVYLRALYYPSGFLIHSAANLAVIPLAILRVEIFREAATIVMLAAVGFLSFSTVRERIAAFVFAFSVWDIFYYLFLYVILGWPPSLATLDVYFLIPWPWIGPVWFPLGLFTVLGICSLQILLGRRAERS